MGGEGSTTHGIGGKNLSMPVNYIGEKEEISTGMRFFGVKSHSRKAIKDYILGRVKDYDPYEKEKWDCEDHCFLAASEIRCKFLGQPVAVALGTGKVGAGIAGEAHALLVLWFSNQGKWESEFFDPTYEDFVADFDTKVIIPLPISGFTDKNQDLPFKKNIPLVTTGAWALDYRSYDYALINGAVMATLTSGGIKECKETRSEEEKALLLDPLKRYWNYNDRTFWHFAHLRQKHKGAPIGFAVGTATTPKFPKPYDTSALVLWKQPDDYIYWDVDTRRTLSSMNVKFNPRVVMV